MGLQAIQRSMNGGRFARAGACAEDDAVLPAGTSRRLDGAFSGATGIPHGYRVHGEISSSSASSQMNGRHVLINALPSPSCFRSKPEGNFSLDEMHQNLVNHSPISFRSGIAADEQLRQLAAIFSFTTIVFAVQV